MTTIEDIEIATLKYKFDELDREIGILKHRVKTLEKMSDNVTEIPFRLVRSGAKLPSKHLTASAYDLYLTEDITIYPFTKGRLIGTGIAANFPLDLAGETHARSSINKNTDIRINMGLIDNDYTGEIFLNVDNLSWWKFYKFKKGDRIAQLKIVNIPVTEAIEVNFTKDSERGEKGFGSSGRWINYRRSFV